MFATGILGLHSLLRWIILIFLLINISRNFFNRTDEYLPIDRSWNLRLVIITHINFLIGLFQYFYGEKGYALIKEYGMASVMKDSTMRFWVVEHITGMLIAIVLITISGSISKKPSDDGKAKHKKLLWLYLVALIVIIASIPWPFRIQGIPWLRSLY